MEQLFYRFLARWGFYEKTETQSGETHPATFSPDEISEPVSPSRPVRTSEKIASDLF